MELAVADRLAEFPTKTAVMMIRTDVEDLEKRFGQVAERLREWSIYRKLQRATEMGICADDSDETVPADPRNPFSLLHLLHPSKSRPLFWPISRFSTFMRLAKENPYRRYVGTAASVIVMRTIIIIISTILILLFLLHMTPLRKVIASINYIVVLLKRYKRVCKSEFGANKLINKMN